MQSTYLATHSTWSLWWKISSGSHVSLWKKYNLSDKNCELMCFSLLLQEYHRQILEIIKKEHFFDNCSFVYCLLLREYHRQILEIIWCAWIFAVRCRNVLKHIKSTYFPAWNGKQWGHGMFWTWAASLTYVLTITQIQLKWSSVFVFAWKCVSHLFVTLAP